MSLRALIESGALGLEGLVLKGEALRVHPTVESGYSSYGAGRLFDATSVLKYPPPGIGSSGFIAFCCVPSWAGSDQSFRDFVTLKNGGDSTWQVYCGKANTSYWRLWLNDGTNQPIINSAALGFAANTPHCLAASWNPSNLYLNYDGTEAPTVANTATIVACGPVDLQFVVAGNRHLSYLGPVILGPTIKGPDWRATLQSVVSSLLSDHALLLRDFLDVGDTIYPLGRDSVGYRKVAGTRQVVDRPQVIFDGNSMTLGNTLPQGAVNFPDQTIALLARPVLEQNLGRSGKTIADMNADAAARIDPLIEKSRPANVVVCWEGTNYLRNGATAAQTITQLSTYCAARKAAGFKVVLLTILPCSYAGTPGSFEADRRTVNTSLRANWATYADALSDVAADARIGDAGDETDTAYYQDLLHMTQAGYAVVAGITKRAIEVLL